MPQRPNPTGKPGFSLAPTPVISPAIKRISMTTTTDDCFVSLKGMLTLELNKCTSGSSPNASGARNVQRLLDTATEILSGHFAKIEPYYDPLTPKFLSAVGALNAAIVSGESTAADFNDYVALLAAALQA
jgi:hypothetical protein